MKSACAVMSIPRVVLAVTAIGLAVCSYYGNITVPIALASMTLGGVAALFHLISLKHPSPSLGFFVPLLVILGGRVAQSRIPSMGDWEWWWMNFVAFALVAVTTVLAPRWRAPQSTA